MFWIEGMQPRLFSRRDSSFTSFRNFIACTGLVFLLLLIGTGAAYPSSHYIVVAKDGSGDYGTITAAINSLPMFNYQRVIIFIKNGVYDEKIRITQDNVTLEGQSRDSTIIEYDQLRSDWNAHKDAIGPAVVNIHADDIVIENLTIRNTQPEVGPHAFAVYGTGTRTILLNCNVLSKGSDTVSMWDYKTGMYYYANCSFEGAVDFVCPRGWCFVKDCRFYELKNVPSIWHAGGYNIDQKFVIENSLFDGVNGFVLGRQHYVSQFYLLNCTFSGNIAERLIYRVTYKDSAKDRPFNWGETDYYYNCHREGGDYSWFADNLSTAAGNPTPSEITPAWIFDNKWDPESTQGPMVLNYRIHGMHGLLFFAEPITVIGIPVLRSGDGTLFKYRSGAGSDTLLFDSVHRISRSDLFGLILISGGKLLGTTASIGLREVDLNGGR